MTKGELKTAIDVLYEVSIALARRSKFRIEEHCGDWIETSKASAEVRKCALALCTMLETKEEQNEHHHYAV